MFRCFSHVSRRKYSSATLQRVTSAITQRGKLRQWQAAIELLAEIQDAKIPGDARLISASMVACIRGRQWEHALRLVEKEEKNTFVLNCLIKACSVGDQWRTCLEVFDGMRTRAQTNQVTYNLMLLVLDRCQRWEEALEMLHEMHLKSIEVDGYSYTTVASACNRRHLWQEALSLINSSLSLVQPDAALCTAALFAAGRSLQWQLVMQIYEEMSSVGVLPTIAVHEEAILAVARCNEWQAAICHFDEMQRSLFMPTRRAYNALIDACCAGNSSWRWAVVLQAEAEAAGVEVGKTNKEPFLKQS